MSRRDSHKENPFISNTGRAEHMTHHLMEYYVTIKAKNDELVQHSFTLLIF